MAEIKRVEANMKEIHSVQFIANLNARLDLDGKHLEKRLRMVPDLYRQFRIAQTSVNKLVDGLYSTIPVDTLIMMRARCDNGEVVLRPRSPLNKNTDCKIVLEKDLHTLINTAMASTCAFCMKDVRESKKCPLRKALINVAPPSSIGGNNRCDYANVAINEELGDYI